MTTQNPSSKLSQRSKAAIAGAVLVALLMPVKSPAQWAVFDGSSYAALGKIWSQNVSTEAKIIEEINALTKIYATDTAVFNMAVAMARMVSHPQRLGMIAAAVSTYNNYSQNRYGETVNWPMVMNGRVTFAQNAWASSTVGLGSNPYLSLEKIGGSLLLAHLATIEATDGASVKCMKVLAEYRANQQLNQSPIALLKAAGLDITPGLNSMVGQMNLQNSSNQQLRAEQRSQGQIQACLAEQQMLQNKRQRDIDAENLNFIGQVQSYNATEDDTWTDGASALQGFRLP